MSYYRWMDPDGRRSPPEPERRTIDEATGQILEEAPRLRYCPVAGCISIRQLQGDATQRVGAAQWLKTRIASRTGNNREMHLSPSMTPDTRAEAILRVNNFLYSNLVAFSNKFGLELTGRRLWPRASEGTPWYPDSFSEESWARYCESESQALFVTDDDVEKCWACRRHCCWECRELLRDCYARTFPGYLSPNVTGLRPDFDAFSELQMAAFSIGVCLITLQLLADVVGAPEAVWFSLLRESWMPVLEGALACM